MRFNMFVKITIIVGIAFNNRSTVFADTSDNPYNTGILGRVQQGSSYWSTSNLREWLNADSSNVSYTNNPPSLEFMGKDAYDKEAGFLNYFTEAERNAIAVTERRVWVAKDLDPEAIEGGTLRSGPFDVFGPGFLTNYEAIALNYKKYTYKKDNDKVFLLTPYETYWYLNRRNFSYERALTDAVKKKFNATATSYDWWMQGSSSYLGLDYSYYARNDNLVGHRALGSKQGVVPAINIKPNYIFNSGEKASELKIGDDIVFGTYLNEPISWKVVNISDSGFPLLLSNKVLDLKRYDAPGDQAKKYSDFINFKDPDVSLLSDA